MLQHASVYINHHQGALNLCFAKVNVDFGYISLFEVIGVVAAYFVQSCYACGSCTVQIETLLSPLCPRREPGRRIRTLARLRAGRQRTGIRLVLGSEQIGNSNQLASYTVGGLKEGFSLTIKRLRM